MHFAENTVHGFKGNQGEVLPLKEHPAVSCPGRGCGGWGAHVHKGRVDVVAALAVDGDEEGQAAVRRQDIHAAVLVPVPGQQGDAALLHIQRRCDRVQSLQRGRGREGDVPCLWGLLPA